MTETPAARTRRIFFKKLRSIIVGLFYLAIPCILVSPFALAGWFYFESQDMFDRRVAGAFERKTRYLWPDSAEIINIETVSDSPPSLTLSRLEFTADQASLRAWIGGPPPWGEKWHSDAYSEVHVSFEEGKVETRHGNRMTVNLSTGVVTTETWY